MIYRSLATILVLVHFASVLFVVLGGFLVLRWPRIAWLHVPAALWGVYVEITGTICPLTPLEKDLWVRGGVEGYSGGFIEHYIIRLLYPEELTRADQVWLGVLALGLNVVAYALVLMRRHRRVTQALEAGSAAQIGKA